MNNNIKIRYATVKDAEVITEIAWKSFYDTFANHPMNKPEDTKLYMAEAFTLKAITNDLMDSTVVYLIAEIDGKSIGYAKLKSESTESCVIAKNPIELCRLYVLSDWIGHKVGAALIKSCFNHAKENNYDVMWLGVWEFNPRARSFYDKFEFKKVGEHPFQYGTEITIDWVLQRTV